MIRSLILVCIGCFLIPCQGKAEINTSSTVAIDLNAPGLKMIDADAKGLSDKRITGVVPDGWQDDSAWARLQADYKLGEEEGQKYLAIKASNIESGHLQFFHEISAYGDKTFFRLTIKARSVPGIPVEFGVRQQEKPYAFAWSQKVTFGSGWKTYEYLFPVDQTTSRMGFWFNIFASGEVDIASIRLESMDKDQLTAVLKAKFPDGAPQNLLRTTRLPLGLQSGWTIEKSSNYHDVEPTVEADLQVKGVSGVSALHLNSSEKLVLWAEPFDIPLPIEPYTASVYVKGSGWGKIIVLRDSGIIAQKEFQGSPDWSRVEVSFDPKFGAKFYNLRLETTGEVWADAWQVGPGAVAGAYQSQLPMEVSLKCVAKETSDARIQFDDEPAQIAYFISRIPTADGQKTFKLRARVINLYGEEQDMAPIVLSGDGNFEGQMDFNAWPQNPLGSFRIEAWIEGEKGERASAYQEIIVHRLHRPRFWGKDAPDSPFGIHVGADTLHATMAKAAGINWVRTHDIGEWWFAWWYLEKEPGQWNFSDQAANRFRKQHLKILGTLTTTPYSASYFSKPHDAYFDRFYQPKDPSQFANYAKTVAERYKGIIDTYEIWNEPWNTGFFSTSYDESKAGQTAQAGYVPSATPQADYARLTKVAAAEMRKVDPSIKVIGINSTNTDKLLALRTDISGADWSKGMSDLKSDDDCDILGYHHYEHSPIDSLGDPVAKGFDAAMGPFLARGVKKPIWLTEGSARVEKTTAAGLYHYTLPYSDPEDVLATGDRLCRFVVYLLANHVEKVFLYSMGCYQFFGSQFVPYLDLVTEDGDFHPSGAAFSAMTWQLEGTRFVKYVELKRGNRACLFSGSGRSVAVIIPGSDSSPLIIADSSDWKVTDLLGNPMNHSNTASSHLFYIETNNSVDELAHHLSENSGHMRQSRQ